MDDLNDWDSLLAIAQSEGVEQATLSTNAVFHIQEPTVLQGGKPPQFAIRKAPADVSPPLS